MAENSSSISGELRPKRREIIAKYCLSVGRHVQIRPVLASITDELIAGTRPSACSISIRKHGDEDRAHTCEVCAFADDASVVIRIIVVKHTLLLSALRLCIGFDFRLFGLQSAHSETCHESPLVSL